MLVVLSAVASLVAAPGCADDRSVPTQLMDGSRPAESPSVLAGSVDPTILTSTSVIDSSALEPGSPAAVCLDQAWDAVPSGTAVVRVGVSGESVTARTRSGIYGCDDSQGIREGNDQWCGRAFGRLHAGSLPDPRLDVGLCRTADGRPVGFAWVEPHRDVRYVVVQQDHYQEVYEVAAGLPVRVVTTRDIETEGSSATFRLAEYDERGEMIRRYTLEATVAG